MSPDSAAWFGLIFLMVVLAAGVMVLRGPLGRALARRIEGQPPGAIDLADVDARLAEVDALRTRVGELEERVDFAERVLAERRHEPAQLEGHR